MNQKQFATEVTLKLQQAGHTALWAGGCVRDALLGCDPKDYDVATSATPEQVRELFGYKRTLPIGASFGVITVVGPKSAGQIEVATFRRDGGYSDGRRPDSVQFTDAREDALRRDFTINGMFFDPIRDEVIDFVGGQEDMTLRRIRAIGDPEKRIEEDKLRMLRGVRFAATLDFSIADQTLAAMIRRAAEITVVSPERIGMEVTRMLSHKNWLAAMDQLAQAALWPHIVPSPEDGAPHRVEEVRDLQISDANDFQLETILAGLFQEAIEEDPGSKSRPGFLDRLQDGWRLKNDQRSVIQWLTSNCKTIGCADRIPWSRAQPVVVHPYSRAGLDVAQLLGAPEEVQTFCKSMWAKPASETNPDPFLVGKDLIEMGIKPGPQFKTILQAVRDDQLDGKIETVEQARARVGELV